MDHALSPLMVKILTALSVGKTMPKGLPTMYALRALWQMKYVRVLPSGIIVLTSEGHLRLKLLNQKEGG